LAGLAGYIHAGEILVAGDFKVGEGFVVCLAAVIGRLNVLDEPGFLQDGIYFIFTFEVADFRHFLHHLSYFRASALHQVGSGLKIAAGAITQVFGFADVQNPAIGVFHQIYAWVLRKILDISTDFVETMTAVGSHVPDYISAARYGQIVGDTAMAPGKSPKVGIVMGSDSDWSVMQNCRQMLAEFDIACDVRISSAHRSPEATVQYAQQAHQQGVKVIIAAAGMAAHLAGVIAAHTILPVIGVPMAGGPLQGIDALLSTVQMPPGVPVATVGIGPTGATNAALLAVQILAINDKKLAEKLIQYKDGLARSVQEKNEKLQQNLD